MIVNYVVGFNFIVPPPGSSDTTKVVLIQKARPEWQKGRLNGVGGHIEEGESPLQAMEREYGEETGDCSPVRWKLFLIQVFESDTVYFFKAFSSCTAAHTCTDEQVLILEVEHLCEDKLLPNLRWIILMCFTTDRGTLPQKSRRPK